MASRTRFPLAPRLCPPAPPVCLSCCLLRSEGPLRRAPLSPLRVFSLFLKKLLLPPSSSCSSGATAPALGRWGVRWRRGSESRAAVSAPRQPRPKSGSDSVASLLSPWWGGRGGAGLDALRGLPDAPVLPSTPVSLLFVTRWTGSSVMAAATSGSIRSVLVSPQRWRRRRTTSVRAAPGRPRRAGNKPAPCGGAAAVPQQSHRTGSDQPVHGAISIPNGSFSRTLWKKEKKQLKNFLTPFVFFP